MQQEILGRGGVSWAWTPQNLAVTCPTDCGLSTCSPFGFSFLCLLTQLFGASKYTPKKQWEVTQNEEYDFIIAGAGASGSVLANRLSENSNWKILLLEAGGEQPDIATVPALTPALRGSNLDWGHKTHPDGRSCLARDGGSCSWRRGKVLGGSSSLNSFEYIRGHRSDYDTWASYGNDGWSYDEVLPYFKKSECNLDLSVDQAFHGTRGELPVSYCSYRDDTSSMIVRSMNQKGLNTIDFNGPTLSGTGFAQTISRDGQRVSAYTAFVEPIRFKRTNLVVRTESEVLKVLINNKKRAYGVSYMYKGQTYTAKATKEVILSSGVVNSAKLLMLSGVGPSQHLREHNIKVHQDLPVGMNMIDHVSFGGLVIALNFTATLISNGEMLREVYDFSALKQKTGPLTSSGPSSTWSFYNIDRDATAPQIGLQFVNTIVTEYLRDPTRYEDLSIHPSVYYDGLQPRPMIMDVKSRGQLLLNPLNPQGYPLIQANYFQDERDLNLLVNGAKYILDLEYTEAFRSMGAYFVREKMPACSRYQWGTDGYLKCLAQYYTLSANHQVGTCKMGPRQDTTAVVDARLRVHGITGLRVIDESVIPVSIRGDPIVPSLMIGEKGATLIIEEWSLVNQVVIKPVAPEQNVIVVKDDSNESDSDSDESGSNSSESGSDSDESASDSDESGSDSDESNSDESGSHEHGPPKPHEHVPPKPHEHGPPKPHEHGPHGSHEHGPPGHHEHGPPGPHGSHEHSSHEHGPGHKHHKKGPKHHKKGPKHHKPEKGPKHHKKGPK